MKRPCRVRKCYSKVCEFISIHGISRKMPDAQKPAKHVYSYNHNPVGKQSDFPVEGIGLFRK